MRRLRWIVAAWICTGILWAQTSAYQSADGNTSITLNNAKANAIFNVSNTQFDLGYLHEGAGRSLEYGFDITGKPSSNLSTQIFQKGNTPPALGGTISLGLHQVFAKGLFDQTEQSRLRDDWALVRVTFTRSTFSTLAGRTQEPVLQHFDGFRIMPSYNALVNAPGGSMLLGISAGVARANNAAILKQVTINVPLAQSAPGIAPYTVVKQSTSYLGTYQTFLAAPVFTDVVWIPKKLPWVDFDAFTRSNAAHVNRFLEGGIGLFLAQPENPTKVLGGFSLGWQNGAPSYALVAGFSF